MTMTSTSDNESSSGNWIIGKEFRFEAAHKLPNHDGKCARLHGHSWRGVVYVSGNKLIDSGSKEGMIMDFGDISKHIKPLVEKYLDHHYLNESTGLTNPTSEAIAKWIYEQLEPIISGLVAVRVDETCTSQCVYSPVKINLLGI